jgi:hypothetical protein
LAICISDLERAAWPADLILLTLITLVTSGEAQVKSCGIYGGQRGTGAGFLRVLRFPLPILIPPTAPHSSSIVRLWYSRPVTGRRTKWAQSHLTPRNKKKKSDEHKLWSFLLCNCLWRLHVIVEAVKCILPIDTPFRP